MHVALFISLCLHPPGTLALFAPSPSSVILATIARRDTAVLDDAWVPVTLHELAFNGDSGWPTVSSLQLDDARCASGEPCFARNRCPYDGYGAPRLSPDGATLALGGEFTRTAATLSEAVSAQRVVVEVSARGVVSVFNFSGACEATGQASKTCGTFSTTTVFSAQSVGASGWALACREMFQGTRFVSRNDFAVTRMDDGDRNYAVFATSALSRPGLTFFSLFLAAASASKGYGIFNLGNASSIGSRAPPYAAYLTGTDVSTTPPVCSNGGTVGAPSDVWVESTGRVWACVPFSGSGSCPAYGVQLFVQAYFGAPWGRVIDAKGRFLINTPCSSLTGRLEGSEVVLYATTCLGAPRATCVPTLRRIVYNLGMETTIATAPVGTMIHGVALPPCASGGTSGAACPTLVNGVWKIPSPSPSGTTPSPTTSPTASPTRSGTPTGTAGAPPSTTPSSTGTASPTGSPSGSASCTPSSTPTGTPSSSADASPSPTSTAEPPPSDSFTPSETGTPTGSIGAPPSGSSIAPPTSMPSPGVATSFSPTHSFPPLTSPGVGLGISGAIAMTPGAVAGAAVGGSLGALAFLSLLWHFLCRAKGRLPATNWEGRGRVGKGGPFVAHINPLVSVLKREVGTAV